MHFTNNHQEIFTYLANCNASIDDVDGSTVVHIAASMNQIIVLNYLITKKNADANVLRKKDNWTPLHCAAFGKHSESFRYLIEHGANIEAKDVNGTTPLQVVDDQRFIKNMERILKKRSRRSVGEFFHTSSFYPNSTIPNYHSPLRITRNVRLEIDGNLVDLFAHTYPAQIQNLFTILHLVFGSSYSAVHTKSFEEEGISPIGNMDPLIERAIQSLPDSKE